MKKKKNKVGDYVQIHAFWGSPFARATGMGALDTMLKAWVEFYRKQNKGNELVVEMRVHPMGQFPFVIWPCETFHLPKAKRK